MAASARVVHSIVCCRILLNLRQAADRRDDSTEMSTALAFATTPQQQTNQAETIGLEGPSEEEDPRLQVDGTGSQDGHLAVGVAV